MYFEINQKINITMHQPATGKFPIGRAEDGRICKIKQHKEKAFYEYGSVWSATVISVSSKCLLVEPFELIRSAAEDQAQMAEKLATFAKFKESEKQPRKKKESVNYQFYSKNELRRMGNGAQSGSK